MNSVRLTPHESRRKPNEPDGNRTGSVATGQCLPQRDAASAVQKRILVVDDHHHSREGLRESLLGEGHEVEAAADSWQALKKLKEVWFELAIIDLGLPPVHGLEMSGWDLIRICRAFQPAIIIIVVSADVNQAVNAHAKELGVSAVLEKPIDPTHLKAIVRTLDL